MGEFSMPFEVVAPADPAEGTATVLFEAPHWGLAAIGRDLVLGRELIFGRGIGYAAVGFGVDGGNILDPTPPDLVIAGTPVSAPGVLRFSGPTDPEILVQFTEAIRVDPTITALHGGIERLYAYGISRSADVLTEVQQVITSTVHRYRARCRRQRARRRPPAGPGPRAGTVHRLGSGDQYPRHSVPESAHRQPRRPRMRPAGRRLAALP
ncbi:MAG: hypothetical protein RQ847_04695 [Wenzhouxiangellaceae bacterium]|nr:hypothetical protein [Wenzhouxiangellaceae bacterium]